MKKTKLLLTLLCLWVGLLPTLAQSVTIVKELQKNPYANVLVMYKNDFGSFEKPDMSITFPYALIRMHLEGNAHEVKAAKERLTLDMGQLTGVEARVTTYSNQILFLLRAPRHPMIYIDGGDGCDQVLLSNMQQLQPNCLYDCTVQFTLEEDLVPQTTTQAPKRQFFKFRVTPTNAVVTIVENGVQEILPMREGGIASKMLNYGTYHYSIAADKYHTKEGAFTVSATQTEMTVELLPKFGWLTIAGDNTSQGGYIFATHTATSGMTQLGTIPLENKEMSSGVYTLRIQKEKYKDYSTTITIEEGKTTTIRPSLEANFTQVTLTTNEGADIYVDGNRLGTTRWTGTLELGEHSVETRQASHHSAYTNVRITAESAGQTITLNNPLPIYGSLVVDGSPADVAVYVDGKKVGTSPLLVSELLIGSHTVRLEKEGYAKQEKTVQIAEGQEHMMDYTLAKETPKAAPKETPKAALVSASTERHEYVDLGLSVKWATCNVGASRPEEYGDYFAWGETKPKSEYDESTYSKYSWKAYPITLPLSDDAARANWGGSWRMPTMAEQDELRKKCKWKWTTQNGVNGYKVTSKKNGNSIFLPAAGFRSDGSRGAGRRAEYWSRSLESLSFPYTLSFSPDKVALRSVTPSCYGVSVRPVCP